jgi:hypothetical protein
MQVLFRLAYSLAVAILFVLFVVLGTRTFYKEPDAPVYPTTASPYFAGPPEIECYIGDGICYRVDQVKGTNFDQILPLDEARKLYPDVVRAFEEAEKVQREEYQVAYEEYLAELVDHRRNVFIIANVLGVLAMGAALYLFKRVEAMPLGLLGGGIGVVIFGWMRTSDNLDEIGAESLFAVAAVCLAVVLAAGYGFLGLRSSVGEGG